MSDKLQKIISAAGLMSRRAAEKAIEDGRVVVNGQTARLGDRADVQLDQILVDSAPVSTGGKKIYIVLNKPCGYVTTMHDEKGRHSVNELVDDLEERVYPVGRLDINSEGLLIMTNDGDLTQKLTHPKHEVSKTYIATVAGVVSNARLARLRKGVDIGGFVTSPAQVRVLKQNPRSAVVEISIHEGKNRQVRKMFAAVGNKVQSLERVAIGDIRLGRLLQGHYRKLTRPEIEYLKSL